jgi:hypothetical protein
MFRLQQHDKSIIPSFSKVKENFKKQIKSIITICCKYFSIRDPSLMAGLGPWLNWKFRDLAANERTTCSIGRLCFKMDFEHPVD